jgi:hypothetical protein
MGDGGRFGEAEREGFDEVESTKILGAFEPTDRNFTAPLGKGSTKSQIGPLAPNAAQPRPASAERDGFGAVELS